MKFKWIKEKVSIWFRLRQIRTGLDWLVAIYIPSYNHDTKEWSIARIGTRERIDCFISCIDTAIRGYVYRLDK